MVEPSAMAPHLPGAAKVVRTGSDEYQVSMKLSMGFLRPTVKADVLISNVVLPISFDINLRGKSMGAGVEADATVVLKSSDGVTRVRMVGTVQTSGLLTKVSDSKVDAAVTGFLDDYFGRVERGIPTG